jgi:hypothetical protein
MKLQRYPDGGNAWALFIWGRHPKWSLTWTHSLTLTKQRRESGQKRFGLFRIPGPQARYGAVLFGFALQLMTQRSLRRETP